MRDFESLLKTHLFIIKKLQRDAFLGAAGSMDGLVLDIGCAGQFYRRYLRDSLYIGLDSCFEIMPNICADAAALPITEKSVDTVICMEVIEHVENPLACLQEIARVLKTGGRLFLSAPQGWALHYEPYDYWRFTKYGLSFLVRRSGFEITRVKSIGGPFTLIGQQIVDICWYAFKRILSFSGQRLSEKISTLLLMPASFTFCAFGMFADRLDNRYALGNVIVAVKK